MIDNQSRKTSQTITLQVQLDITDRGWLVMRGEEESPYDLIVDLGLDESGCRNFVTIQVKKDLRTSSRPSPEKENEPVSVGGKNRNSYWYFDKDVTYLATVKNGEVIYYHKSDYQKLSPTELKRANQSIFPINENMFSYRREVSAIDRPSLELFL